MDEDPENARQLLEEVLDIMINAVRDHDGTVNQVMGDGLMAIFGAPLAFEDHALQACHAALSMQQEIKSRTKNQDRELEIRVGICSGEVITSERGEDFDLQYTAFGRPAHFAARMEQLAQPGSILIAEPTWLLVSDQVDARSLGPVEIRGHDRPITAYELIGLASGTERTRRPRTMLPFIGRDFEWKLLVHALNEAAAGQGRFVVMVGEPGIGKSRLMDEFISDEAQHGWEVLRAYGMSHSKPPPFSAIIEILSTAFGISAAETPESLRRTIAKKLETWDKNLNRHLAALLALFEVSDQNTWQELPADQRRRRVGQAVIDLIMAKSRTEPILVAIDDMHWIDADSVAILSQLARTIADASVYLLVAYRPGYLHSLGENLNYFQLPLQSLPDDKTDLFLDHLLGTDESLVEIRKLLRERTGGNPFFLEEIVRSLVTNHALQGRPGTYRLERQVREFEIPLRVQDVIAMRIDRLQAIVKRILQAAAVIGYELERAVLAAVMNLSEEQLSEALQQLESYELLLMSPSDARGRLVFKHAITHDVAYKSLLHDDRTNLHFRTVEALENRYGEALEEYAETIAFHARRAEIWNKAIDYLNIAGRRSVLRSACQRAAECYEEGLELIETQRPEGWGEVELDMRLGVRNALMPLGRHRELLPHLQRAEELATALNDEKRLALANSFRCHYHWLVGEWNDSLLAGEAALRKAVELDDLGLAVSTRFFLGLAAYSTGNFDEAVNHLTLNADCLVGERTKRQYGMFARPSVVSRGWLAWCLIECGRFDEAICTAREALEIADESGGPFDRVQGRLGLGGTLLMRGKWSEAIPLLETALKLCEQAVVQVLLPRVASALGHAYALEGRTNEAVSLATRALDEAKMMRLASMHTLCMRSAAEIMLLAGQPTVAAALAEQMLASCHASGEAGHEAWAYYLEGVAQAQIGEAERARTCFGQAETRAAHLGMKLLLAHIYRIRGQLNHFQQQNDGRGKDYQTAAALFEQMGIETWSELPTVETITTASSPGISPEIGVADA